MSCERRFAKGKWTFMSSLMTLMCLVCVVVCCNCASEVVHRWPEKEREEQRQIMLKDLVKVQSVLSGDTIRLKDGRIVKYIGVEAPKIGEPFFAASRDRNAELLFWGRNLVHLEADKVERDSQGRYLYYVYTPSRILPHDRLVCCFVNKELLEYGFVLPDLDSPNLKYVRDFLKLAKLAREEKRGLWGKQMAKVKKETSKTQEFSKE